MAVAAGGVLIAVGMVAAQSTDPSAKREFDTRSVAAGGGPVVATITVSGATQAVVTESLPTGFTYVSSSLPDNQVRPDPNDDQRIRFVLADSADNPFTYTVTVSQTGSISGKLTADRVDYDVTGHDSVTVQESIDESTDPSAMRAFDTRSVAAGGGPVVATITVSGATQAVVTESLPTGFTYESSSLPDNQVRPDPNDGQRIRFVLADSADNPFTYTVTVSQTGSISGKLTADRVDYDVTGHDSVTVQESIDESTDPSAMRAFDTRSVAAGGGPVVATITVSGATQAVVTESLPTGFTYESSSLPDNQVRPDPNDGQRIRFVLADSADNPFTYTVTVSQAGAISGKLTADRVDYDVTGHDSVTVQESTDESTDPSAKREFDTRSVAAGGGPVVATITVSGATQAVVTESLPTGFTYESSSLPDNQVRPDPNDAQRIRFVLADSADNPFTYTVTVSQTGAISGKLTVDRLDYDVTGHDSVTVQGSTDPSAMREFDTRSVAAGGGPVVATITVSGATQAVVTESLPTGFTYVSSSLPDNQVRPDPNDAQRIRFVLADSADNPFKYSVTVSQTGGISGKLTVDRLEYPVTGHDRVTVGRPVVRPTQPTATATPRPSTGGGGTSRTRRDPTSTPIPRPATATPTPTRTPTAETGTATPTPMPTPTATPTPTPTPTAVPAPVATPTPSPRLPSTGDTLPLWLVPLAILGLLLAIGGALLVANQLLRPKDPRPGHRKSMRG